MTRDAAAPAAAETLHHASGSHVVVAIGIDRYAAWPHLGNAVNDARKTSALFGSLGFIESSGLYDEAATGSALRKLVTDDLHTLGVSDSLVVFFAGHGGTRMQRLQDGTEIQTGYIIPIDADNKQGEVASWIRLDTWLAEIARLPPNHILVILDACHGGIALDSLIRWRSELALYLQKRVREYPHSRQTPDFGAFELDDRGEMMLPRQRPLVILNPPNPRPLRPAAADPPGAATWSHLGLQLRWPQTEDDNATLVTEGRNHDSAGPRQASISRLASPRLEAGRTFLQVRRSTVRVRRIDSSQPAWS